ncbi:hypothetical protein [Streptomyces spinosus]|uniref:hypothetical protein n=1 Tax=Streptomyces spinosus TaxID=2872623 RepID=UPI001CECFC35|nr:hypothetical protein [Streptomyces spinosus]
MTAVRRTEAAESWLRAVLDETGYPLSEPAPTRTARALEAAGAQPGGGEPLELPADLAALWAVRDETAELQPLRRRAAPQRPDAMLPVLDLVG